MKNRREFVKKILQESLTAEEQGEILSSPPVTEKMKEQWETAPDRTISDDVNESRMWKHIREKTFERVSIRIIRIYKTVSWAASILLLIVTASSAYFLFGKKETNYIVTTGIQNISSFQLPDGTNVHLGSNSKLIYPAGFDGDTREIWINGQAFVDVRPDKGKPFIVHTSQMDVEAMGTAFEVFAYDADNSIETILLDGQVKVSLPGKNSTFILTPNEKIEYNKELKEISHSKVNAEKYTSWRKGILSFENEKLSMIVPRLEQWYGRKIFLAKKIGETYKFTFKLRDEPLDRIFYIMGESSPVRYSKMDDGNFTLFL